MRRWLIGLLKVGVSVGLVAFLLIQARDSLGPLGGVSPQWGMLALAGLLCLVMVVTAIVRWYLLVRALELPFQLRDAFRLGFLGYMLNFVSLGSVGGDVFRAVFIAREQPGRRAEAVATVFIDRVIGLYGLFLLTTLVVLFTGLLSHEHEVIRWLCRLTLLVTAVSTLGLLVVLTPGFTSGRLAVASTRLPYVGMTVQRLLDAVRVYRREFPILVVAGLMSVAVHALLATGIYVAARALTGDVPTFGAHFLIVPLSTMAAALPVSVSGVGVFEGALELLYVRVPSQVAVAPGTGTLVGLTYRAITIGVAVIGFGYYLANRAAVAQVMRQAEESGDAPTKQRQTVWP